MRYNHESYLPIGAFQPVLGRMRLHGPSGNPLDVVSDVIGTGGGDSGLLNVIDEGVQGASDVLATVDDAILQPVTAPISQLTSALDEAVIQPITAPISDVGVAIDDAVADVIPGGWGTLAQVAAAATGNPYIIGATSAGVNFARNKDLKSAVEAGLISGGTAGITQGLGEAFQLGDIGRAGVSAGIGGALDYAKTGDINSALKAGAMSGGQSYLGGKLGEYASPYLNEIKGDFGQYLQDKGLALSEFANPTVTPEGAVTSAIPEPSIGKSFDTDPIKDFMDSRQASSSYDPTVAIKEQANIDSQYTPKLLERPVDYITQKGVEGKDYVVDKATGAIKYLTDTPVSQMPGDLYDAAKNYYNESSPTKLALTAAGLYGLSNLGGGSTEQAQSAAAADAANKVYTYGTAGPSSPNYLLKNRINASNVYSPATGYRPVTRYADGGEVQHFGLGGKVADFATRITQPFEKAVLRPIGEAAPFLKDLAPYAGIAAGALMGNPAMAAGIGGLASGFGKPGGFDMKRALMGGIAAYGMSNLAGGLEAAGTPEAALPAYPEAPVQPSSIVGSDTMFVPQGPSQAALQAMAKTDLANTPRDMFSLRDTDAMQKGIGNLLQNTNTPAYKDAMAALTNKVGMFSTGLPLIMGTTGVMGVDESNALKQEYDKASAANQAEADKFSARVAAGKKRAQQAVSENPYMFADGGVINPPDDQTGMPNQTPMQKFEDGGVYNFAQGGMPPRFLSGGGDGMSDSIRANIEGAQEARLADGEFVIPADVVSHLGNGSSKAGAKQLYAMMDRVRKARTGNPKQGREIKPTKLMPV